MNSVKDGGLKKVVVLGAGFGGIRAAKLIARKIRSSGFGGKYEVILVDRNDHHVYTPLLYEVATTSKETADLCELHRIAAYKIKSLLGGAPIKFVQGELENLDLAEGDLHLSGSRKLDCDIVVLALGSEVNYFGIKGLEENSLPLKTFADAVAIRDTVWNLALEDRKDIKIVIGGGGSTGVELAGEFKAWCGELNDDFPRCRLNVTIVEGSPAVLSGFDGRIMKCAEKRLRALDVELVVGRRILSADKNNIALDDGRKLDFDVLVWAGGVKAPSVVSKMPIETEPKGRAVVAEGMECLPQTPYLKLYSKIYGLGDSICFYDPKTKKPIAGVARAAILQADVVAHNVLEEIKAAEDRNYKPRMAGYLPKEYPYVVPIGGKYAIAKIGPFIISGFFGWVLKGLVELNYLFSIMPFPRAVKTWLQGLKIFVQNDRLG